MNFNTLINPVYDLKQFKNINEAYKKNELAYLEQYYSKYYFVNLKNSMEDLYIYQAPNKLCVIGLAPAHPLLQRSQDQSSSGHYLSNIQSIEYDAKVKSSINKKSIKAGVAGWIIDTNTRFEHEKELLQNKPFKEGYIAIIKPKQENSDKSLSHCFSEDRYKLIRNLT
ncbi:protein simiate [Gigaspora margarita]|uniref:Protein Abitram n=1 Tax=Gigaspora margarita TaxID=4874 RepID=A0A8H3XAK7_GIGMA|nr:protein simiate [Gigaspora margarita]